MVTAVPIHILFDANLQIENFCVHLKYIYSVAMFKSDTSIKARFSDFTLQNKQSFLDANDMALLKAKLFTSMPN